MSGFFSDFHDAQRVGDGRLLATCIAPINTRQQPHRMEVFAQMSNHQAISADVRYHLIQAPGSVKLSKAESNAWVDIFTALWRCIKEIVSMEAGQAGSWSNAFDAYKEACTQLIRGYTNNGFPSWTIPCLTTSGDHLRMLGIKADREAKGKESNGDVFANGFTDDIMGNSDKNAKLEQAAWTINRMFTICLSDRAELHESRKWGIYSTTNLLFKTYFKLNSISLTKNVIRALQAAQEDLPPLEMFPKSHRCTFKYYRGVIDFLQENYADAEANLSEALSLCHASAQRNRERILTYLIPTYVLTKDRLPKESLLTAHPTMDAIFTPLFTAIRQGNLLAFDRALSAAEPALVHRRIYLTLERTRDICMRNLFRKVFLYAGFEEPKDAEANVTGEKIRRTRIRVEEFEAAMRVSYRGSEDVVVDRDEVECFLANMIYKGMMKGYIARERGVVVLSKAGAFPGTGV
jgi:COP9 signalosome complex subunit 12